jgi:small subunit ribosomal protein S1
MMPDSLTPPTQSRVEPSADAEPSFGDMLSQYEQSHSRKSEGGGKQLVGTVVAVSADAVVLDIGFKSEGTLPLADLQAAGQAVKPGD